MKNLIVLSVLISITFCSSPRFLNAAETDVNFSIDILRGLANGLGLESGVPDFSKCNPFDTKTIKNIDSIFHIAENWRNGGEEVATEVYQILKVALNIYGDSLERVQYCGEAFHQLRNFFKNVRNAISSAGSSITFQIAAGLSLLTSDIPSFIADVETRNGFDLGQKIGQAVKRALYPNLN